jgi:bifunctional non-homologous end joining protein LigD
MLLQRTESLPEGSKWAYEVKLDGYRALAIKANGRVQLRSRNNKDFSTKYQGITKALAALPDETVIDGEIVALDETGRPSFSALQNYGSARVRIVYYVFDVLILSGRNIMPEHLPRAAICYGVAFFRRSTNLSETVQPWTVAFLT